MEVIYLYCAFSYLWVFGAAVKSIGNKMDSPMKVIFGLLLSPIFMPIMLGANWYDT